MEFQPSCRLENCDYSDSDRELGVMVGRREPSNTKRDERKVPDSWFDFFCLFSFFSAKPHVFFAAGLRSHGELPFGDWPAHWMPARRNASGREWTWSFS